MRTNNIISWNGKKPKISDSAVIADNATVIGDVEGKTALIVDDEIDKGGTGIADSEALREYGAREVYCSVTHAVLSGDSAHRIDASPIHSLVVTDTLPVPEEKRVSKLRTITVAALLGEAIQRIHKGLSVGAMFTN